jgi:predicted transcriptional regulator
MPRKPATALTDAESRIMAVLWRLKRATVTEVVAALSARRAVSYSTIQTILRILENKGYVAHDKEGRAFVFHPIVDERQARRRALRHLIGRLFNGSPSELVRNVLDDEQIDPEELRRVKALIEQA